MGKGAAALAAAPAIHQGPPAFGFVEQIDLDVSCYVFRDQRGADLLGFEHRYLLVKRADAGALLIVQHRHAQRIGQVIFGKFTRRAGIDDGIEFGELRDRRHALGKCF